MSFVSRMKKNKETMTDIQRMNRTVLICYVVLCVALSVLGIMGYGIENGRRWAVAILVIFYTLLWLPVVYSLIRYKRYNGSVLFRVHLYAFFILFYIYVVFTSSYSLAPLLAIPFMIITIAYCKLSFSLVTSALVVVILGINILVDYLTNADPEFLRNKIYIMLLLLATAIFLNIASRFVEIVAASKQLELSKERDRLHKLASVGMKRIFEYDVKNDRFMTSRSEDGRYGQERYIDNFSEVTKQYRYVLLADWYIFENFLNDCIAGVSVIEHDMRLRDKNADYKWYRLRGRTMFDDEGKPDKVIGIMTNIDEIKRMELRQADENMRDPLTKLYRRHYAEQLIGEFLKSQSESESGEYAAVITLDIDNFNILNERMGKAFGDEILKNIASDLDNIFYPTDILGRIGGDEFIILMKNIMSVSDIEKKIQEIQKVVSRTYVGENLNFGSTAGIGAAVYPTDGESYDILYDKAEKALFHAKHFGMNCYRFYDATKEDEYAKYPVLETRQKRREEEEAEQNLLHGNSDSLIELAFKLIDESKDTDSAINLLIRQVAKQMGLGGIRIRSRVGKEFKMTSPYMCTTVPDMEFSDDELEYSLDQWGEMLGEYRDHNGIIAYKNVEEVENGLTRSLLLANGAKSYVGCAFYDKGEFAGNIDFVNFDDERDWTPDDLTTIRAVANVVSSYLLKMKAYEDASDTVERLTGYDTVTGLMKYEKFLNMTSEYIENAPHGSHAIVYLDFSNFKYINETYGYEVGDRVLGELATECSTYRDFFIYGSRVFSDNIVILAKVGAKSNEDLAATFERVSSRFTDRIEREYKVSRLIMDIGVCRFEINGKPVPIKNIISNANVARKKTKSPDNPNVIVYDDVMGDELKAEIAYANDMESAFRNHEFVVFMQPKVNLQTNTIEGAEALIRWKKGDGTLIFPNDFIPVFEKNKSITLLDYFVYDEVCKYIRARMDAGKKVVRISVNVSRVHLYSIDGLVGYVKALLSRYNIPPKYLEFELTETVFTDKVDDTVTLMSRLRELGVNVSMDDFGSGYSSLNVLTKLPLDVLKLDKEFLDDFDTDSDEKLIIPSIIDMAKKLNLTVVCEGVETSEQVNFLREVGCDFAQGYFYSKPIPQDRFDELLEMQ